MRMRLQLKLFSIDNLVTHLWVIQVGIEVHLVVLTAGLLTASIPTDPGVHPGTAAAQGAPILHVPTTPSRS